MKVMDAKGWMASLLVCLAGIVGVISLIGIIWYGVRDARRVVEESDRFSAFLRAQVEERDGRLERYLDPDFFKLRGNTALSDRMDQPIQEFDPTQPFDVLPENLKEMLLEEGWRVILYEERIGEKGSGQIVGQMDPAERTITLMMQDPKRTTLVLYHEIGHILAERIRTELIRAGYVSRETLPDIVFHGGADTAYHEDLYEEYLANYLAESVFWSDNALKSGEDFFRVYLESIGNLLS